MATWVESRDSLSQGKGCRLVVKEGWFWSALGYILEFLHIMPRDTFLNDFATTLGPVIAFPSCWPTESVRFVLPHETQHVKQFRWCGVGCAWVGLPVFGLLYLLFPLPVGFAFCRFFFELNAEKATWRFYLSQKISPDYIKLHAIRWTTLISSSQYGWSIPCKLALYFTMRAVDKVIAGD